MRIERGMKVLLDTLVLLNATDEGLKLHQQALDVSESAARGLHNSASVPSVTPSFSRAWTFSNSSKASDLPDRRS